MRRLRYSVAMSLDGFIADRHGGYDWIVEEPAIDFEAFLAGIDTLVMGRGTYETALGAPGGLDAFAHLEIHVVSTTLDPVEHPYVRIIDSDVLARMREMKQRPPGPGASAKDVWLFGGGVLFRSLLEAGLVDRVEVAVVPVLLGEGVPVLAGLGTGVAEAAGGGPEVPPVPRAPLHLHSVERFDSGMLLLKYDVRTA